MNGERSKDARSFVPPAARPTSEFSTTQVGDDEYVVFDDVRSAYHTLNGPAWEVWQRCDGRKSIVEIEDELDQISLDVPPDWTQLAVEELGNASLLQAPGHQFDPRHTRRRILQTAAGVGVGAVLLPIVKSISAPESASAESRCPGSIPCTNVSDCWAFCSPADPANPAIMCVQVGPDRCCTCP